MPSKSKAQQRFFGMVDAYKKGEMKNPSNKIKKAANGMSMSDVKDFAETKHKGLPEKVEEGKVILRMTESEFKKMVNESVNKILTELDWKTYINAARKRNLQADELRGQFPRTSLGHRRNSYDDKSDELVKAAQASFQKKHGKNGHSHQYEGDSPDFKGRYTLGQFGSDKNFDTKNPTEDGWWGGEKADGIRHYRYGNGFPSRNGGYVHDDTFDYAFNNKEGWAGDRQRHHTLRVDGNGIKYEPNLSTVDDEVSQSKDKNYRELYTCWQ